MQRWNGGIAEKVRDGVEEKRHQNRAGRGTSDRTARSGEEYRGKKKKNWKIVWKKRNKKMTGME